MFLILTLLLGFAEITVAQTRETVRLSISGKIHAVDNRALSFPSILKQHHDHCCSSFKHSSIILKKYLRIEATLSVKHGGMFFVNSCSFFQNILLQFVARFQLVWCQSHQISNISTLNRATCACACPPKLNCIVALLFMEDHLNFGIIIALEFHNYFLLCVKMKSSFEKDNSEKYILSS